MFRRNETKTRKELLRAELGESWDHALRAAGHAAGGMRATVGPKVAPTAERVRGAAASRWDSTRAALAPVGEAAQHKVQGSRSKRIKRKAARKRWPVVAGLLAGGAAVGGAAAYLLRRRQQQQWQEYQHTEPAAVGSAPVASSAGAGSPAAGAGSPTAGVGSSRTGSATAHSGESATAQSGDRAAAQPAGVPGTGSTDPAGSPNSRA